jgi:NodT family efflux transporter outer membrane factor (OMF) lipoprotein
VLVLAAALLAGLAGCGSLPSKDLRDAESDVPAHWAGAAPTPAPAASASSLAQWWLRFDDPLLARLVDDALLANPDVRSAQAALRQARALRDVSAAGLLPELDGSASAQHNTTGRHDTTNAYRAGLDASWELDIFSARRSALDASEATARASAASLGDVQVSVAAEVALGYITLRGAQARLAIAGDNLASQQETLQITQWRLQAGLVTSLEAEQAQAAVEQTGAQLPALQTRIEQARHALAVLTGRPPAALSALLAAPGTLPQAPGELVLDIPTDTLRQRPDVRAAEHQVSAAAGRVAQADAQRLPAFKLSGSLGLNALTLGTLTNGASVVSALMAGVSGPLFDGGAGKARVRAEQAALDQAQLAYRSAVLAALKDVEDALVALRGDGERLARLQRAAEAAANASLLARQRYGSGLVDFQTVLETQRTQLSTQDSVAAARADVGSDHVRLYKALGGGWRSPAAALPGSPVTADIERPLS